MTAVVRVTQPYLPDFEEFVPYLRKIWDNKILTNCGPFHEQFEEELREYLGVGNLAVCANGTLALVTALQALRIQGEVITTPYSFVATSHSLLWNGITPVFVDVDPATLNLDPAKIEAAITPKTTAILAVHCYGHPCDVDAIAEIAHRHNLRVVYDAAHAFGVRDARGSILNHGDMSALSFHATKVFNTFEGGAIVVPDHVSKQRIDFLKNFGHDGETSVVALGINGKLNEFGAALGLVQLNHVDDVIARRGVIDARYRERLDGVAGIRCLGPSGETRSNYAYFPILVGDDYPLTRDELNDTLKGHGIVPRRYFFPLIPEFPMYRGLPSANLANLPVAKRASDRVLCLPIYPDLDLATVDRIVDIIAKA